MKFPSDKNESDKTQSNSYDFFLQKKR